MADKKAPQVMDPSAAEGGAQRANRTRVCYAAQTLVAEAKASFPESLVTADYSAANGLGVMLDVTFETHDLPALAAVLKIVDTDPRVDYILSAEGQTLVSFKSSLRTQDSRETFHIASALAVLGPIPDTEAGSW